MSSFVYNTTGAGSAANAVLTTPGTGYTYTTNGTGAGNINWGISAGSYTIATNPNIEGNTLYVKGKSTFEDNANFEGDVTIKGKSLTELIENIERRLAILHPNKKLEAKWEKLKALGDMYRELEAEIIEKEKMWAILKK